ncbi:zinc transporter foi-like [Centruroides sculpturatus]|uniref:zinc transporter foi-like n=1 Tax=Centruroides sculpturatus TaxID=218467 RepID=UPI000C6CF071|nr:zinc transporter foi-like [Centruroides sculpturatus]
MFLFIISFKCGILILGDFAMLLKAGMTVKQALLYNGLSSILCFVGMLIGVALGNVQSATLWVFAGAAGMFLYIALVDMLPELGSSPTHPGSNSTYLLAVQLTGISLGIVIMLIIAIYEHDLQHIVN